MFKEVYNCIVKFQYTYMKFEKKLLQYKSCFTFLAGTKCVPIGGVRSVTELCTWQASRITFC